MNSHPNYVGYDAIEGNPRAMAKSVKVALPAASAPLRKADFNKPLQQGWIKRLESVRLWCAANGVEFCVSPHNYQLAKLRSDHSTIVLWSGRIKPTNTPCIKATFEGPVRHHTRSETAMHAVLDLVQP